MLQEYLPKQFGGRCVVKIDSTSFKFSVVARDLAQLQNIHWMRVLTDDDDRLVVFVPVSGMEKRPGLLKLGTSSKGHKSLIAKGLISQTPWIKAVASLKDLEARKFEMKKYPGPVPSKPDIRSQTPWFIRLMPAFEESVLPSQIGSLGPGKKGIYRYLSDGEVVYIGKGNIRNRYQAEPDRDLWRISIIEYSIIEDDQNALEWEAWWIDRFRKENNGHLPRYNRNAGINIGDLSATVVR